MQIARIIFTAATASFISLTKDATVKTSRVFVVLALFSFETNLLGLAAAGCCSCVARRMLQMLQMLQHSRQLSWQLCASFHLLCLCLSPVSGYFHCQIYFKWVQLSAQLFLFAFRICFCPLPLPHTLLLPSVSCQNAANISYAHPAPPRLRRYRYIYSYSCSYRYICSCSRFYRYRYRYGYSCTYGYSGNKRRRRLECAKQTLLVVLARFAVCRVFEQVY